MVKFLTVPKFIALYQNYFAKALYCRIARCIVVSYTLLLRTPGFWNIIFTIQLLIMMKHYWSLQCCNSWTNTIHLFCAVNGTWLWDLRAAPLVILAPSGVTSLRLGSVQFAVCSVHCAVFTVSCAVFSVQCAVCNVQCEVCSGQCSMCSE